ncbi:MAG: R.Pab1 family restriction endonuclease [bacterium]
MNTPAKIYGKEGKLIIELPLTNPTGKIRVKRRCSDTNYGLPIAVRREKFTENDYVEWQISYASVNPPRESKVEEIVIDNNRVGCELTKLLWEGVKLRLLSRKDMAELLYFIRNVRSHETLEENEKIHREEASQEVKGGFIKIMEKIPIYIKANKSNGYFIEITLKHKQRAVGLQAMVYLCIYVNQIKDSDGCSVIGRQAKQKEFGILEISNKNKEMLIDVVRAFAIASLQHNKDILNIIEKIEEKWRG